MRMWLLNRHGRPVQVDDVLTWGRWFEDVRGSGNRIVARSTVYPGGRRAMLVSTVFLGLDHSFGMGPPLLYETMVFPAWEKRSEWQWRWTTRGDAMAGHRAVVRWARGNRAQRRGTEPRIQRRDRRATGR